MSSLLQCFLWIPLVGLAAILLSPRRRESMVAGIATATAGLHLVALLAFIIYWCCDQAPTLDARHLVIFEADDIKIFIDFYFDRTTAVFAAVGSLITLLVSIFSRHYLHREAGFKRYFALILLFFLGYHLVVFAGNFESLFVGWEIVGVSSFLLVGYYRERYLPIKNSLKIVSVYRLGDIFLILSMWMNHHLWHENITFLELDDVALVASHLNEHSYYAIFIAMMFVLAATIKSAQMPFSTWLPRAMEGPTSSSAIFYGSLSVHVGAYLLLRTYPYWESLLVIKVAIVLIGLLSWLIATSISKVQSSVKTQIAYSTIAQIGLIFVEIALGWHILALVHFAGNAFLRTYQLLVSPSVMHYATHSMFFSFKPRSQENTWIGKLKNSFYLLALKEWNLDYLQFRILWSPFKWFGRQLHFFKHPSAVIGLCLLFLANLYADLFPVHIPASVLFAAPYVCSVMGLLLVLKAFAERGDAMWAWSFVVAGQLFITLSIALLHEDFGHNDIALYLGGSVISALLGFFCLHQIRRIDHDIDLSRFHGYSYTHNKFGIAFLFACLGMIGLPFTPTFIGIDILFNHIHKTEEVLIVSTALSFLFMEIAILRIYARIFLGLHKKSSHAMADPSS